jgi:hypothetical protein
VYFPSIIFLKFPDLIELVTGYHIRIILLIAAYIRSSLIAYNATQHAQHAIRRQFQYPTSPPTLGVPKVNSSNWPNCSSQAISLSLTGAELFAADSQLTCQEITSRSKPISSQAPTTQLSRYFLTQRDYFQTCLWERACKILQRECAVPISRSDRRCNCIKPFLSHSSLSTRALHLPDAKE